MIWESAPWKNDLLRLARDLDRYRIAKRWSERSSARLEKILMLGFYSIRKLVDAHKISDEIVERPFELSAYPWRGKPVTFYNWHRVDEKYDLDNPSLARRSLSFVSNQLIHSYVFMPGFDEGGGLDLLFFNSDRTRHENLFSVQVQTIAELFREVGTNYPSSSRMIFDERIGDYQVSVGPSTEDPEVA